MYGNGKDHFIIINSGIVRMLCRFRGDYQEMTKTLPPFTLTKSINGCNYIHGLIFVDGEDRDKAIKILEDYQSQIKLDIPFFYRGELITTDMIRELNESNGNFKLWEHITRSA